MVQNPKCDPSDRSVDASVTYVCGIPKTPSVTAAEEEPIRTEPLLVIVAATISKI